MLLSDEGLIVILLVDISGKVVARHRLRARYGRAVAFVVVGGGLALTAAIFLVLFLSFRRPQLGSRPPLRVAQPIALLESLTRRHSAAAAMSVGDNALKRATGALNNGSRQTIVSAIALAILVGMIVGRKLKKDNVP